VLPRRTFRDEKELLELANGTKYGLAATVFTQDEERWDRLGERLVAGTTWINCFFARDLSAPFGGARHSGIGREGGESSTPTLGPEGEHHAENDQRHDERGRQRHHGRKQQHGSGSRPRRGFPPADAYRASCRQCSNSRSGSVRMPSPDRSRKSNRWISPSSASRTSTGP